MQRPVEDKRRTSQALLSRTGSQSRRDRNVWAHDSMQATEGPEPHCVQVAREGAIFPSRVGPLLADSLPRL